MRRTPLPAPLDPTVPERAPTHEASAGPFETTVHIFRSPLGVPFALEVCAVARWDDGLLEPPLVEVADVRAVTVTSGVGVPARVPGWLAVLDGAPAAWGATAQALWPASPHYRGRGSTEAEFRAAGAAALRHAAARGEIADPVAVVRGSEVRGPLVGAALERWLHVGFGTPERFATLLLIERIAERDPQTASALRFLDAAVVPEGGAWADLAIDRRVLLEQATPWRYFDRTFGPALAALAAWRRRYEAAYARHYAQTREAGARARGGAERLGAQAATADRLASILACDEPTLAPRVRRAVSALASMPAAPVADVATTAGVRLGEAHPATAALEALRGEVAAALESRLRALSSALAHRVLDGEGDDLMRALAAIQASDVGDLDRVLDDRLAAHLARLVRGVRHDDPLADVAARFPEVRADDLDAAAEAFRDALAAAVLVAPDGVARLAR
jgi:hypothetical protein